MEVEVGLLLSCLWQEDEEDGYMLFLFKTIITEIH